MSRGEGRTRSRRGNTHAGCVVVWAGCRLLAEEACALAAGIVGAPREVVVVAPHDQLPLMDLPRMTRDLSERAASLRIIPAPTRALPWLARLLRRKSPQLLVHADRCRAAPSVQTLRELGVEAVWCLRAPPLEGPVGPADERGWPGADDVELPACA
ncbi:MAG: hypothetical protein R3B72_48000 [Polyangiaceae bacterium]